MYISCYFLLCMKQASISWLISISKNVLSVWIQTHYILFYYCRNTGTDRYCNVSISIVGNTLRSGSDGSWIYHGQTWVWHLKNNGLKRQRRNWRLTAICLHLKCASSHVTRGPQDGKQLAEALYVWTQTFIIEDEDRVWGKLAHRCWWSFLLPVCALLSAWGTL